MHSSYCPQLPHQGQLGCGIRPIKGQLCVSVCVLCRVEEEEQILTAVRENKHTTLIPHTCV